MKDHWKKIKLITVSSLLFGILISTQAVASTQSEVKSMQAELDALKATNSANQAEMDTLKAEADARKAESDVIKQTCNEYLKSNADTKSKSGRERREETKETCDAFEKAGSNA